MSKRKPALTQAHKYIEEWTPKLGFGHYRYSLSHLPRREQATKWARCAWDHEEEFFAVQTVEDDVLPEEVMESLVLHELAHGLISLATSSAVGEEAVCNRLARLARSGAGVFPNEVNLLLNTPDWFCMERHDVEGLRVAIDHLAEDEKDVVNRVFYERQSYGDIARDLGLRDATAVRRLVQRALRSLAPTVDGDQ